MVAKLVVANCFVPELSMAQYSTRNRDAVSVDRTPAFVFDETSLVTDAILARDALAEGGGRLLFAMKSCAFVPALECLAGIVDGFHASSLFEAKLARQVLGPGGKIHLTSPSIQPWEAAEICAISDMISCNSLTQFDRLRTCADRRASLGLRLNPEMSFVADERYDPCRRHSKLGAPIDDLRAVLKEDPARLAGVEGLLCHTNSESIDFRELRAIVARLDEALPALLEQIDWINLGGGYLFDEGVDYTALHEAISLLRERYDLQVYMEPGTSIIRRSGRLVASVVDVFSSRGQQIAVLDASLNHVPESFEFQFECDAEDHRAFSGYRYILAGATCLAGDIFGDYEFAAPLKPGSRVVFENVGAYSMVKAHMFNGINLPSLYWQPDGGPCRRIKSFNYTHFLEHCGGPHDEDL